MTTADILRESATIIRTTGWARFIRLDPFNGGRCALGAIDKAMHLDSYTDGCWKYPAGTAAITAVVQALRLEPLEVHAYDREAWAIADWNNDPTQTAENVAAGLEFAALYVEQQALVAETAHEVVVSVEL